MPKRYFNFIRSTVREPFDKPSNYLLTSTDSNILKLMKLLPVAFLLSFTLVLALVTHTFAEHGDSSNGGAGGSGNATESSGSSTTKIHETESASESAKSSEMEDQNEASVSGKPRQTPCQRVERQIQNRTIAMSNGLTTSLLLSPSFRPASRRAILK